MAGAVNTVVAVMAGVDTGVSAPVITAVVVSAGVAAGASAVAVTATVGVSRASFVAVVTVVGVTVGMGVGGVAAPVGFKAGNSKMPPPKSESVDRQLTRRRSDSLTPLRLARPAIVSPSLTA